MTSSIRTMSHSLLYAFFPPIVENNKESNLTFQDPWQPCFQHKTTATEMHLVQHFYKARIPL